MTRLGFGFIAAIFLALSLVSCAEKKPDPAWGPSEEWRVRSLEENFLDFKERLSAIENANQERKRSLDARMDELSDRMDQVVAEVEKAKVEPVVEVELDTGTGQVVQGGAQSPEPKPWATVPGPATAQPPVPDTAPTQVSTPGPKPSSFDTTGQVLYDQGLALYNQGDPEQARAKFEAFLAANPSHALVPNAMYWIGETFYDQDRFPQAILQFKDVVRRFPKNNKAPAALLKIALAYEKISDPTNAKFYLNALIDDYPDSAPAVLGRSKLAELGG